MNYVSCIIQILEIPRIEVYTDEIIMINLRVQLPYIRNKAQSPTIIYLTIWGDLVYDIVNYYQINDYALVEGYISILFNNQNKQQLININITKFYPFLFVLKSNNKQ